MRKASDKYKQWKRLEDLVLSLNKENLKVIVVASGILYGLGEETFQKHFKSAWLHDPANFDSRWGRREYQLGLPYLGEGDNLIPTIHVQDLVSFVRKVAENPPEGSYLFAIDNS
jgi:adenylate kinase